MKHLIISKARNQDSVFMNCPFDEDYLPIMHAIIYTVYRCGFAPITAFTENNALVLRLKKLAKMMRKCPYGIHDISRTELDKGSSLPRFNMPFELGMFYGLYFYGRKKKGKPNGVILEKESYGYQKYISDLNGVDVKAHHDDPHIAINKIRDWFFADNRSNDIPDSIQIIYEYDQFYKVYLPKLGKKKNFTNKTIHFNDFCHVTEAYIKFLASI